jgi:pyruvate formate-lyase activating enzyme-like uncharacterized protein
MIIELNRQNIDEIKNPTFRDYASIYTRVYDNFVAQVRELGLEIDDVDYAEQAREKIERLGQTGAIVRNDSKSVYVNRFSSACAACRTGTESATFFVSLQCHRNCFFCFNPNQEDYEYHSKNKRDLIRELENMSRHNILMEHVALTGGEPLLFKPETIAFFRYADQKFPMAYKRLYTSGDHVDEAILQELRQVRLDEIRFSVRMTDSENARRHTLDRIALAKRFIPSVMVEMPVLPGTFEVMQSLLKELDQLDIASINLLEFCFPLTNANEFRQRGYKVKKYPARVLYNYWYAGGLPISKSELECLDLIEFAMREKMKIGVHYCSLENKHTGQIYQQNTRGTMPETGYLSDKDFFIKSAKVFGVDIQPVKRLLKQTAHTSFQRNRDHDYLEFHVSQIPALRELDVEVGISWNVMEERDDGKYLREVRIDLTTPQLFDVTADV